jgi:hypothetical protein
MEGIGPNVDIEFILVTGSSDYRLVTDPEEKDSLLYPTDVLTDDNSHAAKSDEWRLDSGDGGGKNPRVHVPAYRENGLEVGTLTLTDRLEVGTHRPTPRVNSEFKTTEDLGVFLEVDNFKVEKIPLDQSVWATYRILKGEKEVTRLEVKFFLPNSGSEKVELKHSFPLSALPSGNYRIEVEMTDDAAKQIISRSAEFIVKAEYK